MLAAGVSFARQFDFSGRVVDGKGNGVAKVVVTNGSEFTVTDDRGAWTLPTDTNMCKFVYISTPSGYCLPRRGAIADFYVGVRTLADNRGKHDFVLQRREKKDDKFYFIAISDPQVKNREQLAKWNKQTIPDLRNTAERLSGEHEVVTMALGDIVWDNMKLFDGYKQSVNSLPVTAFQCIGNHDFDKRYQALNNMPLGTPVYGEMEYHRHFGPVDYSFNIAGVHVVTLKNINYMGNKDYREQITGAQLEWLRRDLSYVPKGSMVILNMHAAAWNVVEAGGNVLNAEQLAEVLKGYRVHVFAGHTHFLQNNIVSDSLYEHNIGAACGTWWRGDVNRCGAPNGYMIVTASADSLSWQYKPTGDDVSRQMSLYSVGEFLSHPFDVVANVWDCDTETVVEWYEDGVCRGRMERFTDNDEAYLQLLGKRGKTCLTSHLFKATPAPGTKEITVVVKNRFGETFRKSVAADRAYMRTVADNFVPKIIAHRGYWRAKGAVQNSIAALRAAGKAGVYGCELDIHATSDGVLIVNHAPHIGGLPISSSTYAQLSGARLANGEKIPTLAGYLEEARKFPDMKIILEIKNQPSDSANAYIAAKAVETVSSLSMQRQVEYISFSADVCDNVLHNDSTAYVVYVGGKLSPEEAKARGYKCLDYSMKIFLRHPEWIDEAHSLGLHVNMWTPDTEPELRMARILRSDFITTDNPVYGYR